LLQLLLINFCCLNTYWWYREKKFSPSTADDWFARWVKSQNFIDKP
jgi:hypothetical protein